VLLVVSLLYIDEISVLTKITSWLVETGFFTIHCFAYFSVRLVI